MALKRIAVFTSSVLASCLLGGIAHAENTRVVNTTSEGIFDRPHTIAEIEAGIITLPNAPISSSQRGGETPFGTIGKGDATVLVGLHLLYRASKEFAFGAGFLLGPQPTSDSQYGGAIGLKRSHARSYLLLGTELRYIPIRSKTLEGWLGLTAGGVIIADRFSTETPEKVPAILGTPDVTVRTEGFTIGAELGGSWMFADRWALGAILRTDRWILPNSQQCTAIGDCGTLTGTVSSVQFGLTIGYRIPL
ncbi:hypothetical protein [Pendulispora albinea]|uniref:Outer membrane beta-barrel domain-containing protein n=1 Tax=Pendulispora albinea TaxID=2741071 RepID=A0ABZ2M0I1_9BACT